MSECVNLRRLIGADVYEHAARVGAEIGCDLGDPVGKAGRRRSGG
jgi:hypothetical protein